MRKRGRSLSFDRPRSLEELETELFALREASESSSNNLPVFGEPVIFRTLLSRDLAPPLLNMDPVTRGIMEANRLKGLAARRQVVADSLKSCIVADLDPQSSGLDGLYEFSNELDGKSVAVMSMRAKDSPIFSVDTRKETSLETPTRHDIDLTLSSYIDALSSDDLLSQLPYTDDGTPDLSKTSSMSRTIPWFDEFNETIRLKNSPTLGKVFGAVQTSFCYLKDFYSVIAQKASILFKHQWPRTVAERLNILHRNFPRGILGYRAFTGPEDPRHIKALIVKQPEKANQQIFVGMSRATRLTEAEEIAMEQETGEAKISKYAPIPDMKRVYSSLPRVHYIDSNRLVHNMAAAEHESTDDMTAWSVGEIRLFLERLAMYGKNFKRISANIPEKSDRDCVDFYYRFKIHLRMKQIVRAGYQSRQERRGNDSAQQNAANYRTLIEESMNDLVEFLQGGGSILHLAKQKQLDRWNIDKTNEIVEATKNIDKVYGRDPDPESPRRERKNAIIDVLVSVIGKGHPVPPQLALLIESNNPSPPPPPPLVMVPAPMIASPLEGPRKLSLSVIQTAVTVLETSSRQLQQHNTI
jgi:hypothetical protein